ncbi:ornithine carbamoyltransferase [Streptacidiphilus sp. MAP12-16]|uniref:ornithine carbamoyltransferase n=1 Tax=Streptacidiphilus sp. MAP12-16 TaxID=3156300 RepID=UPI003518538B
MTEVLTTELTTATRDPSSLLKELDLDKPQFLALVTRAAQLKRAKAEGTETPRMTGRNIALVFEKSSTRTRCAFEVAAHDQGAHVTYLGPDGSHIGHEESIRDTARVLGRMFDGIEFRGFAQDTVEQLADHAGVPVWNGLTDSWHPTQMLADILTMTEHHAGPLEQIGYCFLGDGRSNVARSLLVTGALLGMDVRIAAPRDLWPPDDVIATAHRLAESSGARVLVTEDVEQGVAGVDFVYTDVWVSMGESVETWGERVPLLLPYRVTEKVMLASGKPDTRFLHCLPAVHDRSTQLGKRLFDQFGLDGAEVTDEVFESSSSLVFDQAANRLHTIKAVIVAALGD